MEKDHIKLFKIADIMDEETVINMFETVLHDYRASCNDHKDLARDHLKFAAIMLLHKLSGKNATELGSAIDTYEHLKKVFNPHKG